VITTAAGMNIDEAAFQICYQIHDKKHPYHVTFVA
jgi:hypothetical protein